MSFKILVIGAGNFVGRALTTALGVLQDRPESAFFSAEIIAPNRLHSMEFMRQLENSDSVINCTVGAPTTILDNAKILYAAAAKLAIPPRIVHLSSMTVYGGAIGKIDENAALSLNFGAYGAAQVAAERLAAEYSRSVVLRPGCEYGPDCPQWSGRVARSLLARRLGNLGNAGSGGCNLLYIDDLVSAILQGLTAPQVEGQSFNLASNVLTWNDYFVQFAAALGIASVPLISAPTLRLESRLFAPPLKIIELIGNKLGFDPARLPSAIPPSLLRTCRQDIQLDARKAESLLGMQWTPLATGMAAAAAYYRR